MELTEEVRLAALFMDGYHPGWAQGVNLDTLDQNNSDKCIAGQNGLRWEDPMRAFEKKAGFGSCVFSDREATKLWREEIALRLQLDGSHESKFVAFNEDEDGNFSNMLSTKAANLVVTRLGELRLIDEDGDYAVFNLGSLREAIRELDTRSA